MIEKEIADIKTKQQTQSTTDTRNAAQDLSANLNKPAEMLDQIKGQWEQQLAAQTAQMKDLVNSTVQDALQKRKEQVRAKKE